MRRFRVPIALVIFGLVILIGTAVTEHWVDANKSFAPFHHLLIEIGIALISGGLIGAILETNEWSNYFSKKIRNIVIDPDFLKQLNDDKIQHLNVNLIANQYGEQIKKEDSLYNFFKAKTLTELKLAYRVDYSLNIEATLHENTLHIIEKISYFYHATNDDYIPKEVTWGWDKNLQKNANFIKIDMKHPHPDLYEFKYEPDKFIKEERDGYPTFIYRFPDKFRTDGVWVELKIEYDCNLGQVFGFIQSTPVKNISSIKLTYPEDLDSTVILFGIDETSPAFEMEKSKGKYEMKYDSWCPTKYGVAIQIAKTQQ
jgi:hypothetical protein